MLSRRLSLLSLLVLGSLESSWFCSSNSKDGTVKKIYVVELSDEERKHLQDLVRRGKQDSGR